MNTDAAKIKITKLDTLQRVPAPSEYFSGTVNVAPILKAEATSNLNSLSVKFEASARTAWHTHPCGQLLIVTEGSGLVQEFGKAIQKITTGDIVWIAPNVKHWHGAAPTTSMIHTAIQESMNGTAVEWMEKVSDDQYTSTPL